MPESAIYEGRVRHRRRLPVEHRFSYRLAMLYLDLDELPELFDDLPLWSARRPAPGRFDRRDYHGPSEEPLAESTRRAVREQTGRTLDGPIRLLTLARTFGHCFNPVSFYYCFDRAGERVEAVVAEVTNTPWGERHLYVLGPVDERRSHHHAKVFHVSPFLGMDLDYDWRFTTPGERLLVHIDLTERSHRAFTRPFDATLTLRRRELSRATMLRLLLGQAGLTLRVLRRIYWQAGRLWVGGAPFHPHPDPSSSSDAPPDPVQPPGEEVST